MKIAIASQVHAAAVGGLAAYQRELASGLLSFSRISGAPLSVQHLQINPGDSSCTLKSGTFNSRTQANTRGPLLRIADTLSRVMNHQQSWKLAVNTADVLHFVGSGTDITAHPLWRETRETEVPFTVWPALHPENCDDECFDLQLYRDA